MTRASVRVTEPRPKEADLQPNRQNPQNGWHPGTGGRGRIVESILVSRSRSLHLFGIRHPRAPETSHSTVNVAVSGIEPAVAVIVAIFVDVSTDVVIVKVAVVLPCGTVIVGGTAATRMLLLFSATTCPSNPAGPESVTVPVAVAPPVTCVGDTATLCN